MKKLACVAGLALLATGAFAQGTIIFNNDAASLVSTNNGVNSGTAVSGVAPRVVLYYSTAVSQPTLPGSANGYSFAGWTQTTPTTADNVAPALAGRFNGGTQSADTAAGGSSPWIFVAGWTGGFADFASALAGPVGTLVGISQNAWQQPTGNPGGSPSTPAVAMLIGPSQFNGLVLVPVPEPSTLALAGLGAAALLVFRRRK